MIKLCLDQRHWQTRKWGNIMKSTTLSIREAQQQELSKAVKSGGFSIFDSLEAVITEESAQNSIYTDGLEDLVPEEDFSTVSMTIYEEPAFVACLSKLMRCRTIRQKAVCLGEFLENNPSKADAVDNAALEALAKLDPAKGKQFLHELQTAAPDRNWAKCMSYVHEARTRVG